MRPDTIAINRELLHRFEFNKIVQLILDDSVLTRGRGRLNKAKLQRALGIKGIELEKKLNELKVVLIRMGYRNDESEDNV